jgi:serine protease Do
MNLKYGMRLKNITPEVAKELKLPTDAEGVVVTEVKPGSLAQKGEFRVGDIIFRVEKYPIKSIADFDNIMNKYSSIKRVYVKRAGFVYIFALP